MQSSTCINDNTLGPTVFGCRDDFDFTVEFEQLVFSIVPATLFIVLSIGRAALLRRKPIVVYAPTLLFVKIVSFSFFLNVAVRWLIAAGNYYGLLRTPVSYPRPNSIEDFQHKPCDHCIRRSVMHRSSIHGNGLCSGTRSIRQTVNVTRHLSVSHASP